MSKHKYCKKGKGKVFRPCHVCGVTVNFILWKDETESRGRKIYHWANDDGTHHVHLTDEIKHLQDIMRDET